MNDIIDRHLPVYEDWMTREEAEKVADLSKLSATILTMAGGG